MDTRAGATLHIASHPDPVAALLEPLFLCSFGSVSTARNADNGATRQATPTAQRKVRGYLMGYLL
jgi:hypothetical protein